MCLQHGKTVEQQNQYFYAVSMFDMMSSFERKLPEFMDTAFTYNSLFNEYIELSYEERKERCVKHKMKVDLSYNEGEYMESTGCLKEYFDEIKKFNLQLEEAEQGRFDFTYFNHQEYHNYRMKRGATPNRNNRELMKLTKEHDTFNEIVELTVPMCLRIKNTRTCG